MSQLNPPDTLQAEVLGSGPDLIALHGWGSSPDALLPLARQLSGSYRLHCLSLPGFDGCPEPLDRWATADYAQAVAEYLEKQTASGAAILLGHSFGGQIALQLSLEKPALVQQLILIASAGMSAQRSWRSALRAGAIQRMRSSFHLLKRIAPKKGQQLLDWHTQRYGSADYQAASPVMRKILVRIIGERKALAPRIKEIEHPALLLWGTLDTATPLTQGIQMREALKNAEWVELPGRDHYPFTGGGASLCAQKILDFLAKDFSPDGTTGTTR